ncbi:MAG: PQQ-binding-like beta-propeller repeat protein [Rubripirellula sp.]
MFPLAIMAFVLTSPGGFAADSWPQWRGADQNGVAEGDKFPTKWSESAGVTWKKELPGTGGSTPVIADGVAYVTAGFEGKNTLMAFDTTSGTLKWETSVGIDRGNKHRKGSGSNPSPVIDAGRIYVYYRSGDLACIDTDGDVLWKTNLQERFGEDTLWWDLGSSPTLTKTAVVIAVMQSGPSYIVAFDKKTGDEIWRSDRMLDAPEEAAQSYSTPMAVTVQGEDAIAVMGADHLTLTRASDGKQLGVLGGFNPDREQYWRSISSPVAEGNIIVCPYARGDTLTAVRMDELAQGKGKDAIAWFRDDLGSDVPTPAAHQGRVYVVGDGKRVRGTITCIDIETGKNIWTVQLAKSRDGFSSSPLVAGNHLYVTQENGTTYVIGPLDAKQPEVLFENKIGDDAPFTVASPVPVDGNLLLRSKHSLYRIAGE